MKSKLAFIGLLAVIVMGATACPVVFGDPAPVVGVSPIVAVGAHHTCAQNGRIFCWGDNSDGQLGNGSTTSSTTPVEVPGITWATDLSAAGNRTCAIAGTDSNIYCWGDNSQGGLGDGTTTNRSTPTEIPGPYDVERISVGDTFSCALQSKVGVICWGAVPGVAGGATTSPVPIPGWGHASTVSAGADHACAIVGLVVSCLGDNSLGQLGDGTTVSSSTPVTVGALSGLTNPATGKPTGADSVVAGGDHTCAVSAALTTTWCWGDNASGQLGDGTTTNQATPEAIPFPSLAVPVSTYSVHLALGDQFSCIEFDGTPEPPDFDPITNSVFGCWGDNSSGQLADGSLISRPTYRANPLDIAPVSLAAGGSHGCEFAAIITSKALVRCWGSNGSGELGNGTTTTSPVMVSVPGAFSNSPPSVQPGNPHPTVAFSMSPKNPVAGQPVTFTFHLTHPVGVLSLSTELRMVDGQLIPDSFGCGDSAQVITGTPMDETVTLACTIPVDAPAGQWSIEATARGVDSHPYSPYWDFNVAGTSTDTTGPQAIDHSWAPTTYSPGDTVVLTAHYNEPHGPISLADVNTDGAGWTCDTPVIDGSTAPVWAVTMSCVAGVPFTTGNGPYLTVADKFGYHTFDYWDLGG
jgi:alpha-tubulin suppressor-like RCC1 family protein